MYIKDPVHGLIKVIEKEIVNSPYMQRLNNIKQLANAYYVYPGGVHTRFNHSIGVMHLANKYAKHLFPGSEKTITILRVAALLHDVCHGVGSHSYDNTVYQHIYPGVEKGHDQHRITLIRTELKETVEAYGISVEDVIKVWNGENMLLHDILQGELGADRMDFISRDSYFCGTKHLGTIAIDRIISNSTILDGKLHYKVKIVDDIVHALTSRFYMYKHVYYHKTSIATSLLFENILKECIEPLHLIERTKNFKQFIFINDQTLFGELLASKDVNLKTKENCRKLIQRKLPKMIWERVVSNEEYKRCLKEKNIIMENKVNVSNGCNVNLVFMENKNIKSYTPKKLLLEDNGVSFNFDDIVNNINYNISLPKEYNILRIYKL